jgi:hypothetical protein
MDKSLIAKGGGDDQGPASLFMGSLMVGPCPVYAGESGFYVGKRSYSE